MIFEAIIKRIRDYLSRIKKDPARLEAARKTVNRLLLICILLSIALGISTTPFVTVVTVVLILVLFVLNLRK